MNTNLINIKESNYTYDIISKFPLTQIYYECEKGIVNTVSKENISPIYLQAISTIINKMIEAMELGKSMEFAYKYGMFDDTRFEILEDYTQGFINQQQLSDYLRDSYTDEALSKGVPINDVYIR